MPTQFPTMAPMTAEPAVPKKDGVEEARSLVGADVEEVAKQTPLPEEEKVTLTSAIRDYKNAITAAQKEYAQAKDADRKSELAETITQGLAQIAAGMYGLKTGLNLGGLQFKSTDWAARATERMNELKNKLDTARSPYEMSRDVVTFEEEQRQAKVKEAADEAALEETKRANKTREAIDREQLGVQRSRNILSREELDANIKNKERELDILEKKAGTEEEKKQIKDEQGRVRVLNNVITKLGSTKNTPSSQQLKALQVMLQRNLGLPPEAFTENVDWGFDKEFSDSRDDALYLLQRWSKVRVTDSSGASEVIDVSALKALQDKAAEAGEELTLEPAGNLEE